MPSSAMARASSAECAARARAAASAKFPPEPTARIPSSGPMTSPFPVLSTNPSRSARTPSASRVLAQLHGRALEVAVVLLELRLELLEERQGICRAAGESREHLALEE